MGKDEWWQFRMSKRLDLGPCNSNLSAKKSESEKFNNGTLNKQTPSLYRALFGIRYNNASQ